MSTIKPRATSPVVIEEWISEEKPVKLGGEPEVILNDPKYLAFFQSLLDDLDEALEDLELHGRHSDQGYRKLKDWYRKMHVQTQAIDRALQEKRNQIHV